jgi:methionyl-tRNA synthetase
MQPVEVRREYIDVSKYNDLISSAQTPEKYRPRLAEFLDDQLTRSNRKWYVDRPHDSGIAVTRNNSQSVIHTWFSGLPGYYASIKEYLMLSTGTNRSFDPFEDRISFFFGFDCSYSHAVIYPLLALLTGNDPRKNEYYTNAFLKLNGDDFSTSRGTAIWVDDMLPQYSSDNLRLYLCIKSPEDQIENFVYDEFIVWNEAISAHNSLFLSKLTHTTPLQDLGKLFEIASKQVRRLFTKITQYNQFSAKELANLAESFRTLASECKPHTSDYFIYNLLYAYTVEPIMPKFSSSVFDSHAKLKKDIDAIVNV